MDLTRRIGGTSCTNGMQIGRTFSQNRMPLYSKKTGRNIRFPPSGIARAAMVRFSSLIQEENG